jgi:hypothetical protein
MGALSASHWLENPAWDEIYGWEAYLVCPPEEASCLKFNSDQELRLATNSSLDRWLDLSA